MQNYEQTKLNSMNLCKIEIEKKIKNLKILKKVRVGIKTEIKHHWDNA